jgi:DNA polymerase-3 subunit gamma/tau
MAYEPLHHKYRPQTFAELVGQSAIATTLTNALRQRKIAPAYLFTGARGTGKTSSARILAKSLNCLAFDQPTEMPCGVCEVCRSIAHGSALDVIEIDAASNTGVDNIRELIERAQFAPVQCRYKVYVIDECHMLSTAAFNALLKTLEEPPDRVVFVLATTDPQRVLPTIISRCQRFDFRRIELEAMVRHLSQIAAQEAIEITPDALQLMSQLAQGGLRDAQSTLDQLSLLEGQITVERVWDLVGAVPERDLLALVQAIAANDATGVIDCVRQLMDRGREPLIVLQNLASFYRDLLIAKTTPARQDLVAITPSTWSAMCQFAQQLEFSSLLQGQQHLRASEVQVKNTTQPRLWLEVALIGLLPANQGITSQVASPKLAINPQISQLSNGFKAVVQAGVERQDIEKVDSPISSPPPISPPPQPARAEQEAEADQELEVAEAEELETAGTNPATSISLEQMWQTLIGILQPPGTQALFKQQGRLLALEAETARIGITSQPLFKMAQLRVANLETAFAQLVNHPVRVSLEVVAAQATASSGTPAADPAVRNVAAAAVIAPPETRRNGSAPSHFSPQASPEASNEINPAAPAIPNRVAEPSPAWQEEDEVSRAAKSLAQMFNGQVVTGAEEMPTTEASRLSAPEPIDNGDPDDDVPF